MCTYPVKSQNLRFHRLHNNTATGVSENLHPGRSFQMHLNVGKIGKTHKK